jgi:hypothetical protein
MDLFLLFPFLPPAEVLSPLLPKKMERHGGGRPYKAHSTHSRGKNLMTHLSSSFFLFFFLSIPKGKKNKKRKGIILFFFFFFFYSVRRPITTDTRPTSFFFFFFIPFCLFDLLMFSRLFSLSILYAAP